MKTPYATLAATLILWGAVATNSSGQFTGPSPVGEWDCLVSGGGQQGITFIRFNEDATFDGYQILTTQKKDASDDFEGRNPGGGVGRYPTVSEKPGKTNVFGFGDFSGSWAFDSSGQVIGSYTQILDAESSGLNSTNAAGVTTSVSFRAKVVPGKRLTMKCSTATGDLVFKGIPLVPLPDVTGSWYGTKKQNDRSFVEFFDLLSLEPVPNIYMASGAGPNYKLEGTCMRSKQGKIAFGFLQGETNRTIRTSIGSFSTSSKAYKSNTKGIIAGSTNSAATNIKFDAVLTPSN